MAAPPPGLAYAPAPAAAAPSNGMGTAALILSILGIIGCIPFIGSILGIIFGWIGMKAAKEGRATNGGAAKAGFIIGIIALILWTIISIIYILVVVIAVANDPSIVNELN